MENGLTALLISDLGNQKVKDAVEDIVNDVACDVSDDSDDSYDSDSDGSEHDAMELSDTEAEPENKRSDNKETKLVSSLLRRQASKFRKRMVYKMPRVLNTA